jgi:hypothetical protein
MASALYGCAGTCNKYYYYYYYYYYYESEMKNMKNTTEKIQMLIKEYIEYITTSVAISSEC